MQAVSIKNKQLIETLNWFSNWLLVESKEILSTLHLPEPGFSAEESCSIDYLESRQQRPPIETGFPLESVGFDIHSTPEKYMPEGWTLIDKEMDRRMISAIGVEFSALKMYYPPNGFIGWHNNSNCYGQNLIMTYTPPGGSGYFEYQDPITKELIRMEDIEGWTAKVGYFGSDKEPDKVIWHCARNYDKPRLTVSYVVRDQWMWEEMVKDIQSDQ